MKYQLEQSEHDSHCYFAKNRVVLARPDISKIVVERWKCRVCCDTRSVNLLLFSIERIRMLDGKTSGRILVDLNK